MSEHFDVKLDELLAKSSSDNPHEEAFPDVVGREFPNGEPTRVGFKRLSDDAIIPTKAHATDSGYDLFAAEDVIVEPGDTAVVPTGIAIQLPEGYEAQVRPRSGVSSRTKLRVQLGTIDNGYYGEVGVIVDNIAEKGGIEDDHLFDISDNNVSEEEYLDGWDAFDNGSYLIRKGDKLAQLVVQPLPSVEAYEITEELGESERGSAGFGSTGVRIDDEDNARCLSCGDISEGGYCRCFNAEEVDDNEFLEAFQDYQGEEEDE